MKCSNCGGDLREGATFCTICGTRIEAANPSQQPPPPPPPWPPAPPQPVQQPQPFMPQQPLQQPFTPPPPVLEQYNTGTAPVQQIKSKAFEGHVYTTQLESLPQLKMENQKKVNTGMVIGIIAICLVFAVALTIGILVLIGYVQTTSGVDSYDPVPLQPDRPVEEGIDATKDIEEFDIFMDEFFEEWVTNDTLTMNYFLADPYTLGIERPEATYGEVTTAETIIKARQETEEIAERLNSFRYASLREDQKIVYDIMKRGVTLFRIIEQNDEYFYYTGYIRPLNGIQVQLPILLAEFSFYTAEDIEHYLDLLEDTYRYFSDIIEFERERSRRGYFLCEANTDSVIEQIESYLENREDNLLITVFDYRIDNYEGLSQQQRDDFKERNKELILENVLHAYDYLLETMYELRGVGARQGGLASLPGGRELAHAMVRSRIGTDRSVEEWADLLKNWLGMTLIELIEALHGEAALLDRYLNDELGQIPDRTPEEYIEELADLIAADFPQLRPTQLNILEVHESLQEHMSPAFYLAPAVDRFDDNVVYVNPSSINDNMFMFTVLAHESYPGHMYQSVYFLQQSPHPIRTALSNTGYSEGWATYAEMMSYFYTDLDEEEANLLWNFRFFDMLLSAYIDLGVNLIGWDIEKVTEVFIEYGLNEEVVDSLYTRVTGVPLFSMTYSMGFIELIMLKIEAERSLQSVFDLLEFHRFILETGSAPYPILREYMFKWIDEAAANLKPAA